MTREEKMKIVINNYFKTECSVNTSIREAFEKGFRIGASKVQKKPEVGTDCISRQAAIDFIDAGHLVNPNEPRWSDNEVVNFLKSRPSAQPERTCVNCGRTANNGGWYADGGTRCPIEEHYALPKDGYCHLWEKRNVTDDDYTERREE